MSYDVRLQVFREATTTPSGTQEASGVWTPTPGVPQKTILYDGPADVQDVLDRDDRDTSGLPAPQANGVAFLQIETDIGKIDVGDKCLIFWSDRSQEQALVVEVRRLDGSLMLNRLRPS